MRSRSMALTSVVKMENYRLNWEQARLMSEGRHLYKFIN